MRGGSPAFSSFFPLSPGNPGKGRSVGRSVGWAGGEALSEDKRAEVRAPICPRIFYPALVGWIDACVLGSRFGLGLERLSERREMAAEARNMPLFPTLALPLLQLTKPVEDIHTKIIPI